MGRKDTLSTEYLSDNARFADICNYCLFDGQNVIRAENLRKMDTKEFLELAGLSGKGQQIQRIRDILKGAVIRSTGDCTYLILGVENQTEIHYAMPVRGMIYEASGQRAGDGTDPYPRGGTAQYRVCRCQGY